MAGKNYYTVLNVPRSASTEEIKQTFRNLALKFHPDKNKKPEAGERFKEIVEAYTVLSDEERRKQYDRSREETISFATTSTFEYQGSSRTLIDDFFGDVVDDDFITEMMDEFTPFFHGSDQSNPRRTRPFEEQFLPDDITTSPNKKFKRQDPAVEEDLLLSLEELFTGITKKLKISRKVYNQFGNYSIEEKILVVEIMPGWKEGTKITFSSEGDRKPGAEPADIVFKLKDKTHRHFSRDSENNLIYVCKMSLRDALTGASVEIPTIDGNTFRITHDIIVQPGTQKLIKGEGLPRPKNPLARADLIIKYDILFPNYLSPHQRQSIIDSLPR